MREDVLPAKDVQTTHILRGLRSQPNLSPESPGFHRGARGSHFPPHSGNPTFSPFRPEWISIFSPTLQCQSCPSEACPTEGGANYAQ